MDTSGNNPQLPDMSIHSPIDADVTLLIPTLGRPMLADCLRSVVEGTVWPGAIVVVDQGLQSDIEAMMQDLAKLGIHTHYLPSNKRGRAAGLNEGLRHVNTEFVCITDDDCIVATAWIETLIQHLRQHPNRVATGQVVAGGEGVINVALAAEPFFAARPNLLHDNLSGGNFAARTSTFAEVGLFDDDPCIAYCEDGEWAYRALRGGIEIAFIPEARVEHRDWRSLSERETQYQNYARSQASFYGKYLRRADWFIACRNR